ncbi:MAG: M23 family metallopeptidase [Pseudomonadota bacterium]|nr:M23 family metallopeptidase [Pseudomonadota bacterium]
MIWLPVFLFLLLTNAATTAGQIKLNGKLIQGGLVVGWAPPGTKIKLEGKSISQAAEGSFLLGFSHNAKPTAKLEILFEDGLIDHRLLSIGQRDYVIQRINGLPKRKVTPNAKDLALIIQQRKLIDKARLISVMKPYFIAGFIRPVSGKVSGVFGSQRILNGKPRRPHFGLDIAAPEGSEIGAASDGIVIFVHQGMFFNGKTVIINHGLGLHSTYIHMKSILVKVGMEVKKGQTVGTVGKTGRATGPHLHWGLDLNHMPLDPEQLLSK